MGKINNETIEHIYPQTPNDGWNAFKSIRGKARDRLVHDLGNLLLLSGRKNSALQNKPFKQKRDHAEHGYSNSSYSAIEVAKNKDWTPDTIHQRTDDLFNFLLERWNIKDDIWTIGHPDNGDDHSHPDNRFMGEGHTKKAPCWLKRGDQKVKKYTRMTEAEKMIRKIGGDICSCQGGGDLYSSEDFEDLDSE